LGSLTGTRGRIIEILRRTPATASEIARDLGLTYNAVRPHLTALQRDGVVRGDETRRGETRPSVVYRLAPGVDAALSRAYTPFASELVGELGTHLPEAELRQVMGNVGRRLAAKWPRPRGEACQRVQAASELLIELGAPNEVEQLESGWRIRGVGCMLAEAVREQSTVCHAMESLLSELLEMPVRECCERGEGPRCCFEIVS
jgi:predicted ArsR family transcriptional regulator